jgi:hypothetical protein
MQGERDGSDRAGLTGHWLGLHLDGSPSARRQQYRSVWKRVHGLRQPTTRPALSRFCSARVQCRVADAGDRFEPHAAPVAGRQHHAVWAPLRAPSLGRPVHRPDAASARRARARRSTTRLRPRGAHAAAGHFARPLHRVCRKRRPPSTAAGSLDGDCPNSHARALSSAYSPATMIDSRSSALPIVASATATRVISSRSRCGAGSSCPDSNNDRSAAVAASPRAFSESESSEARASRLRNRS